MRETERDALRLAIASQQKWQMTALLYMKMLERVGVPSAELMRIWGADKKSVITEIFQQDGRHPPYER